MEYFKGVVVDINWKEARKSLFIQAIVCATVISIICTKHILDIFSEVKHDVRPAKKH